MKIQELFESIAKRVHIFMDKEDFNRAEMNATAEKLGVKFTARGTGDKDLPGYDVYVTGEEEKVAQFLMTHGLKKGISKKAALKWVRASAND